MDARRTLEPERPFVPGELSRTFLVHATDYVVTVFGDNIEDRVGRARFFVLYLVFGLAALLLQLALTTDPSMPLVGASGAIAGLMGAYVGLFPRARLASALDL
jgi:hypothetical protein